MRKLKFKLSGKKKFIMPFIGIAGYLCLIVSGQISPSSGMEAIQYLVVAYLVAEGAVDIARVIPTIFEFIWKIVDGNEKKK